MTLPARNRYLGGLVLRPPRLSKVVWAWSHSVLAVVIGLAAWMWLAGSPERAAQMPPLIAACALFFIVSFVVRLLRGNAGAKVAAAEALALREQFAEAVPAVRALVPRTSGYARYRALVALGSCASLQGDFVEAAQVYATAARAASGALGKMLAPSAHAHAAFVLAAAGRLDEAERALASSAWGTGLPSTRAAIARARALLFSKQKAHGPLLDLLAAERAALRNSLPRRDRTLLRVLAAAAAPEPPRVHVEPEIARWLALVIPEHRALWEAA